MVNCVGCGAPIIGRTNRSQIYSVCNLCLPRYFNGEFGELPMVDDISIEPELNSSKGIAPNVGVSKDKAKNLSVTVKLNKEIHDKLLKSNKKSEKPMSAYIREIIIKHLETINENKMEDKI